MSGQQPSPRGSGMNARAPSTCPFGKTELPSTTRALEEPSFPQSSFENLGTVTRSVALTPCCVGVCSQEPSGRAGVRRDPHVRIYGQGAAACGPVREGFGLQRLEGSSRKVVRVWSSCCCLRGS